MKVRRTGSLDGGAPSSASVEEEEPHPPLSCWQPFKVSECPGNCPAKSLLNSRDTRPTSVVWVREWPVTSDLETYVGRVTGLGPG